MKWTSAIGVLLFIAGCSFDPAERPVDADMVLDAGADTAPTPDAAGVGPDVADALVIDVGNPDRGRGLDVATFDAGAPDTDSNDVGALPEGATTVVDGALVLHTSMAHLVDDCLVSGEGACDDLDTDGLVDAWEALVLDRFRPFLVFDEQEQWFNEPDAVLAHVGRVSPTRRQSRVMMWLTILYDRDYGSCGSLSAHPGDSERVVLTLSVGPDRVSVERAYTAAHENTPNDHSMTLTTAELGQLEYDETNPGARWVVYPSKNKHATYITRAVCESVSPIPCFDEACGPDGVDRDAFTILADVVNAGEPEAPLYDDLGPLGFPGESAWADQDFCGGHERSFTCPGAVRDKLTTNPFQ